MHIDYEIMKTCHTYSELKRIKNEMSEHRTKNEDSEFVIEDIRVIECVMDALLDRIQEYTT